jgi:hypothetical protein
MSAQLWIALIAQVGLPAAKALYVLWQKGGDITLDDIVAIEKVALVPGQAFFDAVVPLPR